MKPPGTSAIQPSPDGPDPAETRNRPVTLAPSAGGVLAFWRVTGVCMRGQCLSPAAEPGAPYCRAHADEAHARQTVNNGREP